MLTERGHLGMDEAFDRMRRYARDHNLRLSEVAREIVETDLAAEDVLAQPSVKTLNPGGSHM